jgi:hypothetical protein
MRAYFYVANVCFVSNTAPSELRSKERIVVLDGIQNQWPFVMDVTAERTNVWTTLFSIIMSPRRRSCMYACIAYCTVSQRTIQRCNDVTIDSLRPTVQSFIFVPSRNVLFRSSTSTSHTVGRDTHDTGKEWNERSAHSCI